MYRIKQDVLEKLCFLSNFKSRSGRKLMREEYFILTDHIVKVLKTSDSSARRYIENNDRILLSYPIIIKIHSLYLDRVSKDKKEAISDLIEEIN